MGDFNIVAKVVPEVGSLQKDLNAQIKKRKGGDLHFNVRPVISNIQQIQTQLDATNFTATIHADLDTSQIRYTLSNLQFSLPLNPTTSGGTGQGGQDRLTYRNAISQLERQEKALRSAMNSTEVLSKEHFGLFAQDFTAADNALGDIQTRLTNLKNTLNSGTRRNALLSPQETNDIFRQIEEAKRSVDELNKTKQSFSVTSHFEKEAESINSLIKNLNSQIKTSGEYNQNVVNSSSFSQQIQTATNARDELNTALEWLNGFKDSTTGLFNVDDKDFTTALELVPKAAEKARQSLLQLKETQASLTETNKGVPNYDTAVDKTTSKIKQLENILRNTQVLAKSNPELNLGIETQNQDISTVYNNAVTALSKLRGVLSGFQVDLSNSAKGTHLLSQTQVNEFNKAYEAAQRYIDLLNRYKVEASDNAKINNQVNSVEQQASRLEKLIGSLKSFNIEDKDKNIIGSDDAESTKVLNNLQNSLDSIRQLKDEKTGLFNTSDPRFARGLEELAINAKEAEAQIALLKETKKGLDDTRTGERMNNTWAGLQAKSTGLLANYAQMLKKLDPNTLARLQKLITDLEKTPKSGRNPSLISKYGTELKDITTSINKLDTLSNNLRGRLGELLSNRFASLGVSLGILKLISLMRDLYNNVVSIDSALAQLEIVTGQSGVALDAYFDKATQSAKQLGKTVTEILSSIETFARLGYNAEQSLMLANVTGMMSNVGDMSNEEATKGMTSILKAYNIKAEDSERIGDVLTTVGKKYAISASELAEALENGGSSLEAANNSLEQSVAIAAAGNAAVQDASKVGNALKTTSMRVRGAKAELSDMGEEVDDLVSSTPKLRKEIMALSGVDIMTDANTFKSTYDILIEIAKVWDSLSDVNQATLLEDLAGKRNANVIKSIITNIDDLKGAYDDALNSAGNLAKDNAIYMDTAKAKTEQLSAAFETFSSEFLSSGSVGGVVDILIGIVNATTTLTKTFGSLGVVVSGISLIVLIKQFSAWRTHGVMAGGILKTLVDLFKGLHSASIAGASGIGALSSAIKGLSVAEKASAILAIISVIATVGSFIYTTIQSSNQAMEESIQKVRDLQSAFKDTQETVASSKQGLEKMKNDGSFSEFELLQAGVSKTGENLTLTNDQYQRYIELCEQIVGYSPELKQGYDTATSSLSAQNNVLEKAIELLNKKQQAEAKALFEGDNIKSMGLGAVDEYNNTIDELKSTKNDFAKLYQELGTLVVNAPVVGNSERLFKALGLSAYYNPSNYNSEMDMVYSVFTEHWDEVKAKISDYATSHSASDTDLSVWAKGLTDKLEPLVTSLSEGVDKIDEAKKSLNDDLLSALYSVSDWYGLDTGVQGLLGAWVTNSSDFDVSKLASMSDSEIETTVKQWYNDVTEMVKNVSGNKKLSKAIEGILNLDPKSVSASDYATSVDEYVEIIKTAFQDKLTEEDIKLKFGIEDFDSKIVKQQISRLKKILSKDSSKGAVDKYIAGLSYSGLENATAVINSSTGEAVSSIKTLKKALAELDLKQTFEGLDNLETMSDKLDGIQTAYSNIRTAMADYRTTGVLTVDNLQKLLSLGSKYIDTLVSEDGQIRLNTESFKQLTIAQLEEYKAKLISMAVDDINNIKSQAAAKAELAKVTKDNTKALSDYAQAQLAIAYKNAQLKDEEEGTTVYTKAAEARMTQLYKALSLVDKAIVGVKSDVDAALNNTDSVVNKLQNEIQALDKQNKALDNQKKALDKVKQVYQDRIDNLQDVIKPIQEEIDKLKEKEDLLNRQKEEYDKDYDSLSNLVSLTEDFVKQGLENEIKTIDKTSDSLKKKEKQTKEHIQTQKDLLEAEKERYQWQKSIQEKNNAVSQAQGKVNAYAFDNSLEGQANLRSAKEELNKATSERDDTLFEHNIDVRQQGLETLQDKWDKFYESQQDKLDKQKEKLQDTVNDEVEIRKKALALIDSKNKSLYKKLRKYARQYTTKTSSEVKDIWNKGNAALRKYNKRFTNANSLMDYLKGASIKLGNSIDDNKQKQTALNDKIKSLNKKIDKWKDKIEAIERKQKKIDSLADTIKDKQTVLNDKLSEVQNKTGKIASDMDKAAASAKEFIDTISAKKPITGYKVQFGSTTYKVSGKNIDKVADKLVSAVNKSYNGMTMVDKKYVLKHMEAYAGGTNYAQGGISIVDENGYEYKLNKLSAGHYQALSEGSVVFNKSMTDNLIKFSGDPRGFIGDLSSVQMAINTGKQGGEINNKVENYITIQGEANQATIKQLTQAVSKAVIKNLVSVNSKLYQ